MELTVETFALLQHNKKHAELKSREHMEHNILKAIEQRHGKEPLAELERQYHADMILTAREVCLPFFEATGRDRSKTTSMKAHEVLKCVGVCMNVRGRK